MKTTIAPTHNSHASDVAHAPPNAYNFILTHYVNFRSLQIGCSHAWGLSTCIFDLHSVAHGSNMLLFGTKICNTDVLVPG